MYNIMLIHKKHLPKGNNDIYQFLINNKYSTAQCKCQSVFGGFKKRSDTNTLPAV